MVSDSLVHKFRHNTALIHVAVSIMAGLNAYSVGPTRMLLPNGVVDEIADEVKINVAIKRQREETLKTRNRKTRKRPEHG